MGRLEYTFYINTIFFLRDYLLIPAAFCILIITAVFIYNYKHNQKEKGLLSFAKNRFYIKRHLSLFTFMLYLSVLLQATVFNRLKFKTDNPLADIWGGWGIIKYKYYYDFSAIKNILILLPLAAILFFFIKNVLNRDTGNKRICIISSAFGFILSACIELLQVILHAGTLQIADLFYNTLGGILGAFIFLVAKSRIEKMKIKKQKNASD